MNILAKARQFHSISDFARYIVFRVRDRLSMGGTSSFSLVNSRGPLSFRANSTDWAVGCEVFLSLAYAPIVTYVPRTSPLIIDLGSNTGLSVRYWQSVWPTATIVAVEPDPSNIAQCEANVASGPSPASVQLRRCCVGGQSGLAKLIRGNGGEWAIRSERVSTADAESIEVKTIAQLLPESLIEKDIDLLKVDVEGAELELFDAGGDWLARVKAMVVETHPPYTVERLKSDLNRHGWRHKVVLEKVDLANQLLFAVAV